MSARQLWLTERMNMHAAVQNTAVTMFIQMLSRRRESSDWTGRDLITRRVAAAFTGTDAFTDAGAPAPAA